MSADMIYKYCPVCGNKLQIVNGCFICITDDCPVLIMGNSILNVKDIYDIVMDNEDKEGITEVKDKQVVVMNKQTIERYGLEEHKEKSIVISIASIKSNSAFIKPNTIANIVEVLQVSFNDTDSTDKYFGGITYQDAKKISEFVKKYKDNNDIDKIIVQCEAGQSRSSGVAAAILKYLYDDDTPIFNNKRYTPNMLCYREVLTALMYDG